MSVENYTDVRTDVRHECAHIPKDVAAVLVRAEVEAIRGYPKPPPRPSGSIDLTNVPKVTPEDLLANPVSISVPKTE